MRQELWHYETMIRELEDSGIDFFETLCHLTDIQRNGVDVNEATLAVCLAVSHYDVQAYPPLSLADVKRALEREQKLRLSYQDRQYYPHLRGGRKNKVAIYAELAKTNGKDTALRWAARELSPRSMFRLKKLLNQ